MLIGSNEKIRKYSVHRYKFTEGWLFDPPIFCEKRLKLHIYTSAHNRITANIKELHACRLYNNNQSFCRLIFKNHIHT